MKKSATFALVLTVVGALAFAVAYQASGRAAGEEMHKNRALAGPGMSPGPAGRSFKGSEGDTIRTIVGQLGEAPDAEKAALMKKLQAAVSSQFDRDMEHRESELTKLEERFNKLRQQLERRRRAKNDIIELQIKVLVNEAEGLGFGAESSAFELDHYARPNGWYLGPPGGLNDPAVKSGGL
jgi:hypothetical protein